MLPEDARLAVDPYGERCGTGWLRFWLSRSLFQTLLLTVQVRTKLLDEALLSFAAGGGAQLVILGAGFDARAWRFAPALRGVRVFEVDHPATQERKRALFAAPDGADVAWVPFDFEARPVEELARDLAALGHDPARPTLTLWEGVTMYLSEPVVDASVRAIAAWSAPGSRLVFTYLDEALLAAGLAQRLVRLLVAGRGEPLTFGFDPPALPAWLAARGVALEHDVVLADAARLLLPERTHARFVDRSQHVAFARV